MLIVVYNWQNNNGKEYFGPFLDIQSANKFIEKSMKVWNVDMSSFEVEKLQPITTEY